MQQKQRNFTLIELLAVIGIIAVISAIALGVTRMAARKAGETKAKSHLQMLETAIDQYRSEFGYYPQTGGNEERITRDFVEGLHKRGDDEAYLLDITQLSFTDGDCIDPFGSAYRYKSPGDHNRQSYDLWSYGPDKQNDTEDDITNWGRN